MFKASSGILDPAATAIGSQRSLQTDFISLDRKLPLAREDVSSFEVKVIEQDIAQMRVRLDGLEVKMLQS